MPIEGHKPHSGPIRWPPASGRSRAGSAPEPSNTRVPESASLYSYLLDVDVELAQEFDLRMRVAARQAATVRVLAAEVGICNLDPWFDAAGHGPGLLILDGLVAFETGSGTAPRVS